MKKNLLIIILTAAFILSACQGTSSKSSAKDIAPTFEPGQANVTGTIVSSKDGTPIAKAPVHLAEVHRQGDAGAFLYDTSNSPSTVANDQGVFNFTAVSSGEYVIVVGSSSIIAGSDGKAAIFAVYADQNLDTGTLKTDYGQ
jgi:hypothetical protein